MGQEKFCTKCKTFKPADNRFFHNNKKAKDGLTYWCKECIRLSQEKRKEEIKEYQKEYHKTHKKKYKTSDKARRNKSKYEKNRRANTPLEVKRKKQREYNLSPKGKFAEYKRRAKKSGIIFEITFDQFVSFWQQDCFYCGSKIKTIGIDRLDNNKGYEISNCVPCCYICNVMKASLTRDEFIEHIEKILIFLEEKFQNDK